MESLQPELLMQMAYKLTVEELLNYCETSKYFKQLCDDAYFWKSYCKLHFYFDNGSKTIAILIYNALKKWNERNILPSANVFKILSRMLSDNVIDMTKLGHILNTLDINLLDFNFITINTVAHVYYNLTVTIYRYASSIILPPSRPILVSNLVNGNSTIKDAEVSNVIKYMQSPTIYCHYKENIILNLNVDGILLLRWYLGFPVEVLNSIYKQTNKKFIILSKSEQENHSIQPLLTTMLNDEINAIFGFNKESLTVGGYDREGYDRQGYDKEGYDREGYNKYGYDKYGYDKEGYYDYDLRLF